MKIPLFDFQERALRALRANAARAIREWQEAKQPQQHQQPQVLSLTAPTGAGKTIIMAALIEDILFGSEYYAEQPQAVFVWLSDSPQLNEQSHMKILTRSDRILPGQLCIIDETFDREVLADGCIYFLNTQKLGKSSRITRAGDRDWTIWQTLANTVREKSERLYVIIDEAHRGMLGSSEMGRATTIMQKFLKGSEADGLPRMPLVIGMSATSERFDKLVTGIASTVRRTTISPDDVRASGLLKERIFVHYPDSCALETSMGMLRAAAADWQDKCLRWRSYCEAQDEKSVAPVLIVQVEAGGKGKVSDTPLDECLQTIENATGERFEKGQVVHAFGEKTALNFGGLEVPYEEPAVIDGNPAVRVVLFKESLSTGWDCPRAETMMSFRRAKDATYIAQLLGRMIRTPLARRIEADETLNNVHLFLPHFEKTTVDDIVKALREGGGYGGHVEPGNTYETLTVIPSVGNDPFDRAAVLRFINDAGVLTYQVRSTKIKSYLASLFGLAHVLTQCGVYPNAVDDMTDGVLKILREHIAALKEKGEYDALAEKVRTFGLLTVGVDISGGIDSNANIRDEQGGKDAQPELFEKVGADIASQFRIANAKLASEGIGEAYGRMVYRENDPNADALAWMVDTIIFAADDACIQNLHSWAGQQFHSLANQYRQKIARYAGRDADNVRRQYAKVVMDGDPVSKHSLRLPERVQMPRNEDDKEGDPLHLFVTADSGTARIKLGSWEAGVVAEEKKRTDFVCWIRNPARAAWALTLPYKKGTEDKPMYPDLIIVRSDGAGGYVLDILEPHGAQFDDNLAKAHALAEYARHVQPCVERVQLIREMKNAITGQSQFRRLDMGRGDVRAAVLQTTMPAQLDSLFEQYGSVD